MDHSYAKWLMDAAVPLTASIHFRQNERQTLNERIYRKRFRGGGVVSSPNEQSEGARSGNGFYFVHGHHAYRSIQEKNHSRLITVIPIGNLNISIGPDEDRDRLPRRVTSIQHLPDCSILLALRFAGEQRKAWQRNHGNEGDRTSHPRQPVEVSISQAADERYRRDDRNGGYGEQSIAEILSILDRATEESDSNPPEQQT
jgi:hypothetical protein